MTCSTPTTKICTICKLPEDTNQFNKHNGQKDGLGSNCRACIKERTRMRRLNIPRPPKPPQTPKVKKIKAPVDEIAVSMPSIFEVENRGKNYRSFCSESPLDGNIFSFLSYREARAARESFRPAICQMETYENTHRQSTGKKLTVDERRRIGSHNVAILRQINEIYTHRGWRAEIETGRRP